MKAIVVALILMIGVIVVLWFGDTLNALGLASWSGSQTTLLILLFCVPISLGLFVFLSHRQHEQLKAKDHEEPEP
jgi:uncharacterized membrane protein YdjX (TVP38/TMEM64 family)